MKKLIMLSTLTASLNAFGFGELGHSTIGHIAEVNLSSRGKAFVYSIMGGEPMAISAKFPDEVKNDSRYEGFSPYHYFDFPLNVNYEDIPGNLIAPKSADTILIMAPEMLTRKRIDTLQKQIVFRYYMHIIGDIHQPLHVGNTLDRGGNLCDIVTREGKKMNLHSFMDSTILENLREEVFAKAKYQKKTIKYYSYKDLAEYLLEEAQDNGSLEKLKAQVKKTKRVDWLEESRALHAVVYPDGRTVAPQDRAYCKSVNLETGKVEDGKFDSTKIPVLTREYMQEVTSMIKKQILLAGLRLQAEIERMAVDRFDAKLSKKEEERFFSEVMPEKEKDIKKRNPSSQVKKTMGYENHCEH
jgi:hypothetical protein